MPVTAGRRFLTTVLFIDIVGSTAIATELGDARWRDLLTEFRRAVRAELRQHGGREQDTTGDGFLLTFAEPARAIRAAAAIAAAVQELGLDVRAGIHTGECEEIDGGIGGLAVHIGSRVIALAGPAEILATQTVRDVVTGSTPVFTDRGSHPLKGVDGDWRIFGLQTIDGRLLPTPLAPDDAATRRQAAGVHARRRITKRRAAIAVVAAAIIVAVIAAVIATRGGSPTGSASSQPVTLVRFELGTKKLTVVHAANSRDPQTQELWATNGTIWQWVNPFAATLIARRSATGAVEKTLALPSTAVNIAFGDGAIWVLETAITLSGPDAGTSSGELQRIDEVSGRTLATIPLDGDVTAGAVAVGNGAVWALENDGTLISVDPATNRVTGRYRTGAVETTTLIPLAGEDWICECIFNKVLRFDPRTHKSATFKIPEQAYLVGVFAFDGARTLWLLDPTAGTLTSMDPRTGATGVPLGLGGSPQEAVIAKGAVWAAAGHVLDRVDLRTRERTTIALPANVYATTIAVDAATQSLWLGTSPN